MPPASVFNAADYFVDRHLREGREQSVAIECGARRLTYQDLRDQVNRVGNVLKTLDIRPEERVLLLMLDGPEMIAAFFGAIKIGAVPVPVNTRWTTTDYEFVLRDSSARVAIVSQELIDSVLGPVRTCRSVRHLIVVGEGDHPSDAVAYESLVAAASTELE